MENMAVTGVNDASAVYEHGRTVTLSNCYLVNGKRGLYADGGSVTIKDGYIANNLTSGGFDQAGAAIQAINRANICLGNDVVENNTSTCTNVQYNRFTNAESRSYGGAIHLRGSELTIKNALIQKNQISGTDWVCGGAIAALCNDRDNQSGDGNEWTWGTLSKITMYKPAIIDGNTAQAGGGGIFLQGPRVGGDAPTGFDNASKFFMFGGTISNNTATNNEGGGIHQGATYRSYAYLFAGEISGNKTTTSQHWGGGGIFVGEESYMMLPNGASVSSNTAQGLGGGVAACSTGNIIFDENVVMAQNTSHANAWTGSSTQKPYDRTLAQGHAGFQNAGDARDFFSALYASVSGELPNDLGGNNWSGSVDYNLVTNVNTGTLTANQLMGLVNNAPADVQTAALSLSPLKIAGNTSSVHGGGILVNGYMIGGDVEYLPSGPTINFQADKRLLNKDGNQIDLGNNVFEFELLENSEIIAEGKNDANGLITFSPPVVYMPDMTSVTPGNDYSWETSTIFVMREKQDSSSSFEMSKAQYNISLRYRTTLTYVLTYPVYNTQGEHVKDVRVFRADSVIVDDSLKVTDNDGNTVHAALEQADPNLSDGHNYTFNNKILHINPGNPDFINQEIPKKDITVRKVWRNQSGEIFVPNQGMKVTFDLYRKEIGAASYPESPHDSIDLPTDDGAWEYTFQELDSHYEYEVRERNPNPLYDVSHTVSNTVSGSIWVKANHLETNKPYLIGSKDAAGNIVLLSKDSSPYDEDVHRFRSEDKVTLNNEKGKLVTIEGHSYSDAFEYDIPITNNPCYFAKNVNFQGTEGYALVNSSNDSYTRAENWTNGNKSGLMLTDLSGLTEQDRSVSVNTEGIISQKLDGENKTYNYDKTFNWFSTTTKTTSNYNNAYLYEQKPYTKEDPTHSVWTFTNQRRSDYKLVINKIDGETKETLNGVKFELYSSENSIVQFSFVNGIYKADTNGVFTELVTNTDGKITITGLQEGTYSLKETYASQGYVIPEDTISIRINGQLDSADGNEDMVINKTIENHMAYELPETGSAGTKVYTAAGTILLLTGTSLYRYKRRRRRKGGEAH